MSLDSLYIWQDQVSVYCARRIPAHLRSTQCLIQLHLIDICLLQCICLWQISQIHTDTVSKTVKSHERNVELDGRPPPIRNSEKDLTRMNAQLRSGYCRLLGSYKSLNVCAECGMTPRDVNHLFICPAHPTTMTPSNLWSRPADAARQLSYLEASNPD